MLWDWQRLSNILDIKNNNRSDAAIVLQWWIICKIYNNDNQAWFKDALLPQLRYLLQCYGEKNKSFLPIVVVVVGICVLLQRDSRAKLAAAIARARFKPLGSMLGTSGVLVKPSFTMPENVPDRPPAPIPVTEVPTAPAFCPAVAASVWSATLQIYSWMSR